MYYFFLTKTRYDIMKKPLTSFIVALILLPITAFSAVIDNTDAGFSSSSSWTTSSFSPGFYGSNYFYALSGNTGLSATWTFTVSSTAQYDISARWSSSSNRATNAQYTLYNNGLNIGIFAVDQRVNGGILNLLTSTTLQAGTLNVVLTDSVSGVVIADAIDITVSGPAMNIAPTSVIDMPSSSVAIAPGDFISFTGTGADVDGDLPLTYLWNFGVGSGIADSTLEDPGAVQFSTAGSYVVTFDVSDALGLANVSSASVTINVGAVVGAVVVDNVDLGFSSTGGWASSSSSSGFYGTDYLYVFSGNGSKTATWNASITTAGLYDISALWTSHSNRAPDASYSIYSNGNLVGTATKDQRVNGGAFNLLVASAYLEVGSLDVVLTDAASGVVIADAIDATFVGVPSNIAPNGVIDSPANTSIAVGDFVSFTGTGSDTDGDLPLTYLWNFGIGSGVTDSILEDPGMVQFNTAGSYIVTFLVTDVKGLADITPATVTIIVGAATSSTITDNTGSGYATIGAWGSSTSSGGFYGADYEYAFAGTGSKTATWSFAVASDGQYDVSAQWTSHSNRAPNATYTLYNNGSQIGTATVDQRSSPGTFNLLLSVPLLTGTLDVVLSDNASGVVIADAVKVDFLGPVGNFAPDSVIDSPSSISVTVGDYVDFTGTGTDTDGDIPLSYFWSFGASGIGNSTLEDPGLLQFNTIGTFNVAFTVTDALGLVDPTPANVTITVNSISSGSVVDNSDANFSSTGGWMLSSSVSTLYGSDYAYAFSGDGSETATWSFSISITGEYNISAWWTSHSNRAVDAPYEIYNNGIKIDTVLVNQQVNAGQFNLLENYPLQSGTLNVVLNNSASGIVVADAVQVQLTNAGPAAKIMSPSNKYLYVSGTVSVTAVTTDFPAMYSLRLVVDGDIAGAQVFAAGPFQTSITGLSFSEHVLELQILDGSNVIQNSDIVNFGIGDYYVAFGDSITVGIADDIASDNTSNDGRNTGGGFPPILNNLLTAAKGYPHTVIPEGIGGETSFLGTLRISSVLALHPNAQRVLVLFGTNDANNNVKTGLGLLPGDSDYSGSYKDYMQQIIDAIVASGKQAMLAKVPASNYTEPKRTSFHNTVQEYNSVIDELIALNGIVATAPDLYSYLLANPSEISADLLHPNGNGYNSIANLWNNSILAVP